MTFSHPMRQLFKYSIWRQAFNEKHSSFESLVSKRQVPLATAAMDSIHNLYDSMGAVAGIENHFGLELSKHGAVLAAIGTTYMDVTLPFNPMEDEDFRKKLALAMQKACGNSGDALSIFNPLSESMESWLPNLPVLVGQQVKKRSDAHVWQLAFPTPWNTVLSNEFSASVLSAANHVLPRMLCAMKYSKWALHEAWWGGRSDTEDAFRATLAAQWVKSQQCREPDMGKTNVRQRRPAGLNAPARCYEADLVVNIRIGFVKPFFCVGSSANWPLQSKATDKRLPRTFRWCPRSCCATRLIEPWCWLSPARREPRNIVQLCEPSTTFAKIAERKMRKAQIRAETRRANIVSEPDPFIWTAMRSHLKEAVRRVWQGQEVVRPMSQARKRLWRYPKGVASGPTLLWRLQKPPMADLGSAPGQPRPIRKNLKGWALC